MLRWALFWKNRDRKQHRFAFLLYVSETMTGNRWPVVPSWWPDHFPALLGNLNDQKWPATKLATFFLAFDGMLAVWPIWFRNKVMWMHIPSTCWSQAVGAIPWWSVSPVAVWRSRLQLQHIYSTSGLQMNKLMKFWLLIKFDFQKFWMFVKLYVQFLCFLDGIPPFSAILCKLLNMLNYLVSSLQQ